MYKKLFGQTAIYGISSVIIKVLPFLLTPLLTNIFSPEQYAPFVNFYSAVGIISVLLTHGMETTIFRFSNNKEYNKDTVLSNAFLSVFFVSGIFLLLSLIFKQNLANAFKTPNQVLFLVWFIWVLFFDAICAIAFTKLRLEEKTKKFAILKIVNGISYFILVLFFVVILPKSYFSNFYNKNWGVGYTFLANLLASLITLLLLIKEILNIKFKFDVELYKKMINYSWPIMIAGLAGIVNETIDRQFLKYLLPPNSVDFYLGIYGACYKVATIITLFKTAYLLGVEPFIFSHSKNENSGVTYANLMKFFIIIMSIILLFIMGNIYWIKMVFIPNKSYWQGINIVPPILFGTVFLGIYLNLSVWYKTGGKTIYGAIISLIGAFITIIINVIFIPKYNIYASAIATMLSYFVMMVVSYYWGQKENYIPYNTRKFFVYIGLSILFSTINFYFLDQNVLFGNIFLFILLVLIYKVEKNYIKKIIPQKYHSKLP